MSRSKILKIVASALVAGGGIGYLLYSSMADNLEYYKYADEIVAQKDRWIGVRIRLAGNVKEGSIFNKPGTHEYLFTVTHQGAEIPVRYTGQVPDSFAENVQVVVSGRLEPEGHFEADRVFARCPSKYEAESTGSPADERGGHPSSIDIPGMEMHRPATGGRPSAPSDDASSTFAEEGVEPSPSPDEDRPLAPSP